MSENEKVGTTIFQNVKVSDADLVGDPLEVFCVVPDKLPNNCMKFSVISVESTEQHFRGVVVLQEPLDYAKKQFYHLTLFATVSKLYFHRPIGKSEGKENLLFSLHFLPSRTDARSSFSWLLEPRLS